MYVRLYRNIFKAFYLKLVRIAFRKLSTAALSSDPIRNSTKEFRQVGGKFQECTR